MMTYNRITLLGWVINEPELKEYEYSKHCCIFSVAVDRRYPLENGSTVEVFEVTTLQRADFCKKNLHKGSVVLVIGELSVYPYQAKTGAPRLGLRVTASEVNPVDKFGPAMGEKIKWYEKKKAEEKKDEGTSSEEP